jgi:hypothetical protein
MRSKKEIAELISWQMGELTEKGRNNFVERLIKASEDFFIYMYKLHSQGGNITKLNGDLYLIS